MHGISIEKGNGGWEQEIRYPQWENREKWADSASIWVVEPTEFGY